MNDNCWRHRARAETPLGYAAWGVGGSDPGAVHQLEGGKQYWRIDPRDREADPQAGGQLLLTLDLRLKEKVEEGTANTIRDSDSEDTRAARWW